MITKLRVTCNWCDRYTARYTVVTDDGCTINVTGPTAAAQESVRSMCGLPDDAALPDPRPYTPPAPRVTSPRPIDPAALVASEAYIAARSPRVKQDNAIVQINNVEGREAPEGSMP